MQLPYDRVSAEHKLALEKLYRFLWRDQHCLIPKQIHDGMLEILHFACIPSEDTIIRFINDPEKKTDDHFIVSLVYFIGKTYVEEAKMPRTDEHNDIIDYCAECYHKWPLKAPFRDSFLPAYKRSGNDATSSESGILLSALGELRLRKENLQTAVEAVFSPSERKEALEAQKAVTHFYFMYRYSMEPGFIDKSLTEVTFDPPQGSFISFKNTFIDKTSGDERISTGFITRTGSRLYMIGGMDDDLGMKFIGFPNFTSGRNRIPGMLMSLSNEGKIVCARTLFVKSSGTPTKKELGHKKASDYAEELGDNIDQIRNKIDFTLEQSLLYNGALCEQREMVQLVRRLLSTKTKPKFTYADDTAFNPADTSQYTFNAALIEAS